MSNLDTISLRYSKHNTPSKKLEQQHDPVVNKFFGLLTMFCLLSASTIVVAGHIIPKLIVGKIVLHAEKVNIHLDGL